MATTEVSKISPQRWQSAVQMLSANRAFFTEQILVVLQPHLKKKLDQHHNKTPFRLQQQLSITRIV